MWSDRLGILLYLACSLSLKSGAGGIRTHDLALRRRSRYPAVPQPQNLAPQPFELVSTTIPDNRDQPEIDSKSLE